MHTHKITAATNPTDIEGVAPAHTSLSHKLPVSTSSSGMKGSIINASHNHKTTFLELGHWHGVQSAVKMNHKMHAEYVF